MRKFLISATLVASSLAIAAPAAAQWAQPRGNAYGYNNNNYGQVRSLMVRVNRIEQQINQLDRRNILSNREADRLRREANSLERRLAQTSRGGLNGYEARDIQVRIARLEQNVRYQASDGNRQANGNYGGSYNGYDRDRDGRDDRYEDDRGTRRD